jgi:hypothetical protein
MSVARTGRNRWAWSPEQKTAALSPKAGDFVEPLADHVFEEGSGAE